MSLDGLRYHLIAAVADEVGAQVFPHLFRHLGVRFTLEDDPAALEDARKLIGDKSMVTVLGHYVSMEPAQAARRHHERLRKARTTLTSPGKPASRGPRHDR